MNIGIDFDGTVVIYGEVFHHHACRRYGMPEGIPAQKHAIREYLRGLGNGEEKWTELQGLVYGSRMSEARVAPGLDHFLRACRARGIPVAIISHKTEFAQKGTRVNLRTAALAWLEQNRFFAGPEAMLERDRVFFETTRAEKLARIACEQCTHFIDDLPEVFAEPAFPPAVERILYGEQDDVPRPAGTRWCRTWREIEHLLLAGAPPGPAIKTR